MAISAGFGPLVAGSIYDLTGDYIPLLLWGIPAALMASLVMITLPRPPDWEAQTRAQQ